MKKIVFLVPFGSAARVLLRSGVLILVAERAKVVIISPGADDPDFHKEFGRDNVEIVKQVTFHQPATLLDKVFYKLRNTGLIRSSKQACQAWEIFENLLTTRRKFIKIWKTLKPDLVVTVSPGIVSTADLPYLRAAKKLRITTMSVIQQWDNLSTKGLMPFRPNKLALWNEGSWKDAIELQYYDASDLDICGVPHFDLYQKAPFSSKEQFFQKLGLDPNKQLITFTTAPYRSVADHLYVLDILLAAIKKNELSRPVQVLCRLHPLDDRTRYEKYKNMGVFYFDFPGRKTQCLGWDPDFNEMKHLADTLFHSEIIINIASTITIEAAILNRPIINLGFSTSEPERFQKNIIVNHHQKHYKYILETGGIRVAKSVPEFIKYINDYLENPLLDADKRKDLAEKMTFKLDGKSSERVAECILSTAGGID